MKPGDRVAYTNEFLYDMGGWSSTMSSRRGTYVGPAARVGFSVVLWGDSTDGEGTDVDSDSITVVAD